MNASARLDVPAGEVPDYRTFVRFVWSYIDDNGERAVGSPPWMYAVTLDDPGEARLVTDLVARMILLIAPMEGRVQLSNAPSGTQLAFADLEVLHAFLRLLAAMPGDLARHVAEWMLWTLGFRWI